MELDLSGIEQFDIILNMCKKNNYIFFIDISFDDILNCWTHLENNLIDIKPKLI